MHGRPEAFPGRDLTTPPGHRWPEALRDGYIGLLTAVLLAGKTDSYAYVVVILHMSSAAAERMRLSVQNDPYARKPRLRWDPGRKCRRFAFVLASRCVTAAS